ncbi:MAG: hypothetical protein A3K19_03405 [Lentisphaerae bacterium RIFOXYB12_FULL_65_16]|nr:MAG: hypothetical protein A3K18_31580 [Lentisphaerae bacterium RIFOXYA12_64_32]OGV92012.1 MAG: hypothetical protein A3K19_03405 [Lentisphaerae bacterium RIFOXYB12_FULL_65_16]
MLLLVLAALAARAIVPEPDMILFGTMTVDGVAITAANTTYTVEVRTADGTVLTSYQLGSNAEVHPFFYGLSVAVEAHDPVERANAVKSGDSLYLVLKNGGTVVMQSTLFAAGRGVPERVDFGPPATSDHDNDGLSDGDEINTYSTNPDDADSDDDGVPDGFEVANGTNPNQNDATGDQDGDGLNNLDEYTASLVVHYVKYNAAGNNDGSSWTHAFTDLKNALAMAQRNNQVWVAAGTYKPSTDRREARAATFALGTDVRVFGGFVGTETQSSQRNPGVNLTVLSGDIGTVGDDADNAYHIVTGGSGAILDGFTITGGNANGTAPDNSGGGMLNNGASPAVSHCVFLRNAAVNGGGIANRAGSVAAVLACTFQGNTATLGGGLYNDDADVAVTNCVFAGNFAASKGGGVYNGNTSAAVFANCTFGSNGAATAGGAVGSASNATPTLTNSIFWGDTPTEIVDEATAATTVNHSDVEGGWGGAGGNNITSDPVFDSDPGPGPDLTWYTADDDYGDLRLQIASQAIDAGSDAAVPAGVTTDIAGNTRIQRNHVDMGAYEAAPVAPFKWGDVTGDNIAGTVDASEVLQYYAELRDSFSGFPAVMRPDYPYGADVSGDGQVGSMDASELIRKKALLISQFTADLNGDGMGPDYGGGRSSPGEERGLRHLSVDSVSGELGGTVSIPVHVDDAAGVFGCYVKLTYPSALAAYVGFERGTLTGGWGNPVINTATPGQVIVVNAGGVLSGQGSLVVLKFSLRATGDGVIGLSRVQLNDGQIAASGSSNVPFSVLQPGTRRIMVDSVAGVVGTEVLVPVTIDDASDVSGYYVKFEYPATLMAYVGLNVGTLDGQWGLPLVNSSTAGRVIVVGSGAQPLSGTGSLFVLRFSLLAPGTGAMSLTKIELNDGVVPVVGSVGAACTVRASDTVPVATPQEHLVCRRNEQIQIQLSGTSPRRDALTFAIAANPIHGVLEGFDAVTGVVTYRPAPDYTGPDGFTFTAAAGSVTSVPAAVDILVYDGWVVTLHTSSVDVPTLQFGIDLAASNASDAGLDLASSLVTAPGFVARKGNGPRLLRDLRGSDSRRLWLLEVPGAEEGIRLSWSVDGLPATALKVCRISAPDGDVVPGTLGDMTALSELQFGTRENVLLLIRAVTNFELSLEPGWNLVSLPVEPLDGAVARVFADPGAPAGKTVHLGAVWGVNGTPDGGNAYAAATVIQALKGYWVYAVKSATLSVPGLPAFKTAVSVVPGWTLLGPAVTSAVVPGQSSASLLWGWGGTGYARVTVMQPGKAYWAYASKDGSLEVGD